METSQAEERVVVAKRSNGVWTPAVEPVVVERITKDDLIGIVREAADEILLNLAIKLQISLGPTVSRVGDEIVGGRMMDGPDHGGTLGDAVVEWFAWCSGGGGGPGGVWTGPTRNTRDAASRDMREFQKKHPDHGDCGVGSQRK